MKAVVRDADGCRMSVEVVCDDEASLLHFARGVFADHPHAMRVEAKDAGLLVRRPGECVERVS